MQSKVITLLLFVWFFIPANAQENEDLTKLSRLSPRANTTQTIGLTDITIDYGRPSVKGRKLWGDLVPYNEIWRAGANETTTIEFSTAVVLEGQALAAGKYSLFVLPEPGHWTFVLDSNLRQFGAFFYNGETDVQRIKVKTQKQKQGAETLQYYFSDLGFNQGKLVLAWGNLQAELNIEVSKDLIVGKVENLIALAKAEDKPEYYNTCAGWAVDHQLYLDEVPKWLAASSSHGETFANQFISARYHASKGNYEQAIEFAKKAAVANPQLTVVTDAFIKQWQENL